jgi:hypothetical protein
MRRNTHIHRAAIAIGHDINPATLPRALHRIGIEKAGPRVKPGVTLVGSNGSITVRLTLTFVTPGLTRGPAIG